MTKSETCCFSGHRPQKLPWGSRNNDPRCEKMREWIRAQIKDFYGDGYRNFISGMAIGCDMVFAEEVLSLKEDLPGINLFAAVPCEDQPIRWTIAQKAHYLELLSACDGVKTFQKSYTPSCMQARNEYMVEQSSALIACYNGRPGGTMTTIVLAKRAGLETKILDLSEL